MVEWLSGWWWCGWCYLMVGEFCCLVLVLVDGWVAKGTKFTVPVVRWLQLSRLMWSYKIRQGHWDATIRGVGNPCLK